MKSFYEIRWEIREKTLRKSLTLAEDKAKEVRKQNPGFKDGKIAEATNQKLFMFKTEAEAKAHAKKNGGKVVKYSPTNYAVLDKDLTKKPGKKPDGMVKEANMTAAQKAKFDALYKQHLNGKQHKILRQTIQNPIKADSAYHSMIKTLAMKEDTQIDEKTGVFGGDYTSKDHMMGMKNFMSIRDKKAKQRDTEHQAQDPKMAKMGYAKHMMDMDKAKSKAAKKGVNPSKTSRSDYETRNGMNPNRKLPEDTQIDEISMGKMAAYADKAVKSRNDAKARTYSADTHRVAKAGETIRKRKAGADNYNKKMWGYANVAPTKESVELDEKGPAIKQDNIKVIRTADKAHSDAMGRTPAGRKKPTKAPVVEAKVGPSHDEIMKAIGNTQSSAQGMAILQKKFKLTATQARKHMDMFLKDDVQIDEMIDITSHSPRRLASILNNPRHPLHSLAKAEHDRRMMTREATYSDTGWKKPEVKNEAVDSKKFDVYKKHMKTHNLDEPTVRMAHDNPDHGESKRMMKNPKYSKGLELYKASMKEATYSDTGWKKPEVKKDKFGNVIKDKNVAKNLAKSAMKSFKDIRKK